MKVILNLTEEQVKHLDTAHRETGQSYEKLLMDFFYNYGQKPAEIIDGDGFDVWNDKAKVITISGQDVTHQFKEGAKRTLSIIRDLKANTVILKSDSPSCGASIIYDGTFSGTKKEGVGVTTALLTLNNIKVFDETTFLSISDNLEV